MSAADGAAGATTKVVDHGSESERWDLVVLGDGYTEYELERYHADVQRFVDRVAVTPPLDEAFTAVNVHRVDVVSAESGADDPVECAGGTGAAPRTFFDATFCSQFGGVGLDRLLTVDADLATATAQAAVPLVNQVLVVVNAEKYGGSGGRVAVCSTNVQAAEIAIHEIGHSAFGLADEYESTFPPELVEPAEPNVTIDASRTTNKWRDLIAADTPMPSACNPDCPGCVPPAPAPGPDAVGAYEGGHYRRCGSYRPLPACFMRDYAPFCPVCARVIRATMAPFLPPSMASAERARAMRSAG